MGYTINIGSAEPEWPANLDEDVEPGWTVEGLAREDAPTFPGDEMTGNKIGRAHV